MEDRVVRTAWPSPRLVVVLDGPRWYVRHRGGFHRVAPSTALHLAEWLPLDAHRTEPVETGEADVEFRAPNAIVLRFADGDEVTLQSTSTELLSAVALDPDPAPDGWMPTSFLVRVDEVASLSLHFYLPPNRDLGPKRCVVRAAGLVLAEGDLLRGEESAIDVTVPTGPGEVELSVEFDHPEPVVHADARQLGAVLSGVSRTSRSER